MLLKLRRFYLLTVSLHIYRPTLNWLVKDQLVCMIWQAVCLIEESLKSLWLNSSVKYTLSTEKQLLNVIDVLITFYRYFTFSTYPHFIIVCMKSVALIMGVASIINSAHSVSCKDHFCYISNSFHWLGWS